MRSDVIVIGAGPSGLAAALALGGRKLPAPLSVRVLDQRDPHTAPMDPRGTALTAATQAMFRSLGIWDRLDGKTCAIRDIIVTDGEGRHDLRNQLLRIESHHSPSAPACLVQNHDLAEALIAEVAASPSIRMEAGFSFSKLQAFSGHSVVHDSSGSEYQTRLLLAADGRNSAVRQSADISCTTHDYGQTTISFAIDHSAPHDNVAEEHFSPDGVFAVLPLQGFASSIVWGMSHEDALGLMALDDTTFSQTLQTRMGSRLGRVALRGKRGAFPLVKQIANSFIAPRLALIGDAAHAIHPLAGLGLNLGFKDAACLADCVASARSRGEDFGGEIVLERYQASRRFETMATTFAMDALNGLFVNSNPLLKQVRDTGLRLVDHSPGAKSFFMAQAAGLSNDNPRLMRGLLPG